MMLNAAVPGFGRLAAQLQRRAQALARARAKAIRLARTAPDAVWRRAALLWPSFTQG